jgi:NAD(P)-dependent dehydrogenase (short-subunit alcohol dehydrogenase family)
MLELDVPRNLKYYFEMSTLSQVALITGGSRGIGVACVRQFVSRGWKVSALALPTVDLNRLATPNVLPIAGDITSEKVRHSAVEQTIARFGRIDVLINNAGVGLYALPSVVPLDLFSRMLDVNVVAPLALAQLVIPIMRRQGTGTIVTLGSVAAQVSLPWASAYSASKSALDAIHDALRRELRRDCIHLVKVCPGIVETEFRNHVLAGAAPPAVNRIHKTVSADRVASAILRAVERRRSTVFVPRIGRLFTFIESVAPFLMDLYLAILPARQLRRIARRFES